MVSARKKVGRETLLKVKLTSYQESFLSHGCWDLHDLKDNMVQPVDTCMGYTMILGVEMFLELGKTNEMVGTADVQIKIFGNKVRHLCWQS